jgi:hypothetical protein
MLDGYRRTDKAPCLRVSHGVFTDEGVEPDIPVDGDLIK